MKEEFKFMLKVIYRISDKSNKKQKIINGYKKDCLLNAISVFGLENIFVLADHCTDSIISFLNKLNIKYEITANGNAGTCRYIFNNVIYRYNDNDNLYLLEDDYLHLPNSKKAILEGLEIADYVTLYDHPDPYIMDGTSPNPFIRDGLPKSSIYLTKSCHWRSTISTVLTFAAKVYTLKADREIWNFFLRDNIPADFLAFITLTKQSDLIDAEYLYNKGYKHLYQLVIYNFKSNNPKRLLISSIPGMATHTDVDFLSPIIDWSKV